MKQEYSGRQHWRTISIIEYIHSIDFQMIHGNEISRLKLAAGGLWSTLRGKLYELMRDTKISQN